MRILLLLHLLVLLVQPRSENLVLSAVRLGFAGHLKIGDRVQIQGQTGVTRNFNDDAMLQGTPAFDFNSYSKSYVHFKNLPKIIKRLDLIEKKKNGE